ncbi:MAG: hypothetical protein Q8P32_00060 [Candidatus Komeilibacteria bacterium]|nr:hypothetical protein [Candidatus Komeilibacteria bacterium]
MDQGNFSRGPMVQGNWSCSQCGAEIKELPFAPDGDRPIYCKDCHRQRKQDRPDRRSF